MPLAARVCGGYLFGMFRQLNALFLSITLVLTSYSMAVARGQNPDIGNGMVICTGVGMITMTIGPDGEALKTTHICPDAMSLFAAITLVQDTPVLPNAMHRRARLPSSTIGQPQEVLSPAARGPPLAV